MADLSVNIGELQMKNPVMTASGHLDMVKSLPISLILRE